MIFKPKNKGIPARGERNVGASELLQLIVSRGHDEIGEHGKSKLPAALVSGAMSIMGEYNLKEVDKSRREFWEAVCKRPVSEKEMDWQEAQLEVPGEDAAPVEESDLLARAQADINECFDQLGSGKGLRLQGSIVLRALRLMLEHGGTGDLTSKLLRFTSYKIRKAAWADATTPEGKAWLESPLGRGMAEHKKKQG